MLSDLRQNDSRNISATVEPPLLRLDFGLSRPDMLYEARPGINWALGALHNQ